MAVELKFDAGYTEKAFTYSAYPLALMPIVFLL